MTAIVDKLQDVEWSEADLRARATALLVTSQFPDLAALRDRVNSAGLSLTILSAAERARWQEYTAALRAIEPAVQEGLQDVDLVRQAKAVEAAQWRLLLPAMEPVTDDDDEITNQAALDLDAGERAAAAAVVAAARPQLQQLLAVRNRVPAPVDEEQS